MIWPVNGPVVSPFGMRWGRLHAGVDIAVPAGTPIRAAKSGSIALAAPYGGYGNYTCINHGGGLSTCYAHQSSFAITSGSVQQGDVIGYVGCTGHCFGDHLHFEVRVDGTPDRPDGLPVAIAVRSAEASGGAADIKSLGTGGLRPVSVGSRARYRSVSDPARA